MKDLFGEEIRLPILIKKENLEYVLRKTFLNYDTSKIIPLLYNKMEAVLDFIRLCSGERTGMKISLLFNPHRIEIETKNGIPVSECFKKSNFFPNMARAFLFRGGPSFQTQHLLYKTIEMGCGGSTFPNEFPPYVAREIYSQFSAKKILDPCAGWGGRMIGAASIGAYYHGIDPSTKTCDGLKKLGSFLKTFKTGFDFKVTCAPFEDVEIQKKEYDFALTSPPYYDTEKYSTENTQSYIRNTSFEEWKDSFLFPLINKTLFATKKDFVINIGDRQYPLSTSIKDEFDCRKTKTFLSKGGFGRQKKEGEIFLVIHNEK